MKKIGILTFNRAHNYGASLQCLALEKFIEKTDDTVTVKVINYANKKIDYDYSLFRIDYTSFFTVIKSFISSLVFLNKNIKRRKIYKKYIKEHLDCTSVCKNIKDVEKIVYDYDYIIAGSDQIWNPNLTGGIDDVYFLNFDTKAKKIAYAASLGKNKMNDNIKKYKDLLSSFDIISVRELDGCDIVGKILNENIKNVIDPTMLLEYSDWIKYINAKKIVDYDYIFTYTPNNLVEFNEIVNYTSNRLNLGIINFKKKNVGLENVKKNMYCSDPNAFLNYLFYSNIVVTTSFHAVVFSIIYNKKFWVLSPKDNSSRVDSLLKKLGLENRSIHSLEELKSKDILQEINFKEVEKKLKNLREDSQRWLIDNLNLE